jgi:hypothetical protein
VKGKLEWAEADFNQVIELIPQWADGYAQRGLVRLLLGKKSEAEQDFDKCLILDKKLQGSLERLIRKAKQQLPRQNR